MVDHLKTLFKVGIDTEATEICMHCTGCQRMEMKMCFPLLLLICSLCTAELQTESDNEIISLGKQAEPQSRETTNASGPRQTCTPDIQAVLREMSASLAEQKVEIRHLQRENQGTVWEVVREVISKRNHCCVKGGFYNNTRKKKEQKHWICPIFKSFFLSAQAAKLKELELQNTQVEKLKQQQQGIYDTCQNAY